MEEVQVTETETEIRKVSVGEGSIKRQKKLLYLVAICFSVAMLLALWFFIKQRMKKEVEVPEVKYEKTAEVMITEDGFIPETITIKKNTQITFTNTDEAVHTVSSDPYPANDALEGFDSKEAVPPEGSYSFVFTETGEWTYHDDTKPLEFKGTVIVEE